MAGLLLQSPPALRIQGLFPHYIGETPELASYCLQVPLSSCHSFQMILHPGLGVPLSFAVVGPRASVPALSSGDSVKVGLPRGNGRLHQALSLRGTGLSAGIWKWPGFPLDGSIVVVIHSLRMPNVPISPKCVLVSFLSAIYLGIFPAERFKIYNIFGLLDLKMYKVQSDALVPRSVRGTL